MASAPSKPPGSIEDFLWNLHTVLAAAPSPLAVDALKEAYAQHCGHKFAIERWLVVGDGGLASTFKRIPHIVTTVQNNGTTCAKSSLPAGATREQLVEADAQFRRELSKKNAAAKSAKAGAVPPKADAVPAAKKAAAPAPGAKAESTVAGNAVAVPKRAGGPTRPPASIEDFLWNLHSVLEAVDKPLPVDQLKDAYSQHLGHKCVIERFLVVGDQGLANTLKRVPHVVNVTADNGQALLTPTLPKGSTREALVAADQNYRKTLQQKSQAAKAAQAQGKPAAPPAKAAAAPAAAQTRPSEGGGEPDAKRQKPEDAETLSRMLVQGVVRVLQNRAKEGTGPLLVSQLADEFKALWKVPFNLQSAGYTDVNAFLKAWPNKVEVTSDASGDVLTLVKKSADKAKAEAAAKPSAPAAKPAAPAGAAEAPAAKKAAPAVPAKAAAVSAASMASDTPAVVNATGSEGIPSTIPEIQKELARSYEEMEKLVKRQKTLIEALNRSS